METRTLTRVTLTWQDASSHGSLRQFTREEFKRTARPLTFSAVCGWLVTEDKTSVTIAIDYFFVDGQDEFRTLCSYPKAGIVKLQKKKVKVKMP